MTFTFYGSYYFLREILLPVSPSPAASISLRQRFKVFYSTVNIVAVYLTEFTRIEEQVENILVYEEWSLLESQTFFVN